jgi:hypothetical protein
VELEAAVGLAGVDYLTSQFLIITDALTIRGVTKPFVKHFCDCVDFVVAQFNDEIQGFVFERGQFLYEHGLPLF